MKRETLRHEERVAESIDRIHKTCKKMLRDDCITSPVVASLYSSIASVDLPIRGIDILYIYASTTQHGHRVRQTQASISAVVRGEGVVSVCHSFTRMSSQ